MHDSLSDENDDWLLPWTTKDQLHPILVAIEGELRPCRPLVSKNLDHCNTAQIIEAIVGISEFGAAWIIILYYPPLFTNDQQVYHPPPPHLDRPPPSPLVSLPLPPPHRPPSLPLPARPGVPGYDHPRLPPTLAPSPGLLLPMNTWTYGLDPSYVLPFGAALHAWLVHLDNIFHYHICYMKNWGNENYPNYINVMVNYHSRGENRVITQ